MELNLPAFNFNSDFFRQVMANVNQSLTPSLPEVKDPDKAFADLLKEQYNYYQVNFAPLERNLINRAKNDTSLIDAAREDARSNRTLTQGMLDRAASRYGGELSAAQMREQNRSLQRGSRLAEVDNVNNARIEQRQQNMQALSNLANIGNQVYGDATSMAATASQLKANRDQQYASAKANYKSSIWGLF